ncbi:MAG: acetamidase/formamidase family protein [Chloroflexia bacterium]|nr:acetamidase/formamidase family protein [Chloroflexia bacterium]
MTTHHFDPETFHATIGAHPPALRVEPGDTVVMQTLDAYGIDRRDMSRGEPPNPQSGPIWVEGAQPGDALEVTIVRLTSSRDRGWTRFPLAPNVVEPERAAQLPQRETANWAIDREAETVRLIDPPPSLTNLVLPLDPMIGCFGVAPAGGEAISTSTPGPHGGNMDWRGFRPGATVWFPVGVPGALFFAGDGHARQGDGEISGTGIEVSMEMELRFDVRKGWPIRWPRGITAGGAEIFAAGSARPLDQALQHATTEMLDWLESDYGLDIVAASHLMGQTVGYEVGNVYNPAYTVVCRMGLDVVSQERGVGNRT